MPLAPDVVLQSLLEPVGHVYFPQSGIISLMTPGDQSPGLEAGQIGMEGALGVHIALRVTAAPWKAVVSGTGSAWRVSARAYLSESSRCSTLRHLMGHNLFVLLAQTSRLAACIRFHDLSQRLARQLLMTRDRSASSSFQVTQEMLARALGVRRAGVTEAASAMQRAGIIAYQRGVLTFKDPHALEQAACDCYAADRRIYGETLASSER